jgi:DUF1365 family protein
MNPECLCKTHGSKARILTVGGQEIAIGLLKLESPGADASFEPEVGVSIWQSSDNQNLSEVVAEVETPFPHKHRLLDWKLCDAKWCRTQDRKEIYISHFHFHCDDA